jgi:hypothetical protein
MAMRKEESTQPIYDQVDAIYRSESRRVFATLIRLLGDFDLAEERCKRLLPRRWSSGHGKECRPIRARGWFPRGDSKRSTRCGGGRDRIRQLWNRRSSSKRALIR